MSKLKNLIAISLFAAATLATAGANASILTVGDLSSDTTTHITTDTKTGRNYTRFDAINLTYGQTLQAIAPGGAWEGWSIATSAVTDQFIAALLGVASTPCSDTTAPVICGTISEWADGKLGASYDVNADYFFFESNIDTSGYVQFVPDGRFAKTPVFGALTRGDEFKDRYKINFLLYKEAPVAAMPEPFSLALLGLGLAGLGIARRRHA